MAEINVVPYIDVMLVLLVIFMVTAPLVTPSIVNLPTVSQASPQPQTLPVIVNIQADGSLSVRYKEGAATRTETLRQLSDLHAFLARRQQANPDQPVVIAADKTVKYEAVMKVMSNLKQQGIKRVGLLVQSS
jgi:biopolymer transport protein TolR